MNDLEHTWNRVDAALTAVERELSDTVSEFVRIPSVTGDEALADAFIAEWVAAHDAWEEEVVPLTSSPVARNLAEGSEHLEGRNNHYVRAQPRRSGVPVVYINAHYDVVPVLDRERWSHDPFSGEVIDGRVYGRGTVDTKAGAVAALYAMHALSAAGADLPFDIVLELTAGEENTGIGTFAGIDLKPDRLACIVIEPTANVVAVANTGMLFFTVQTTGRAVHTSVPWRGTDALAGLVHLYDTIRIWGEARAAAAEHERFPDCPNIVPVVVGKMSGGRWRAALPDEAEMSGRIGLLPDESVSDVRTEFEALIADAVDEYPQLFETRPVLRWDNHGLPGWETEDDEPIVAALAAAGDAVLGAPTPLGGMTCGCDAGAISRAGIPTVVLGPGDIALAHSSMESVELAEVMVSARLIARGMLELGRLRQRESSGA